MLHRKKIHAKLQSALPTTIAVHIPSVFGPLSTTPIFAQPTKQHGCDQHTAALTSLKRNP